MGMTVKKKADVVVPSRFRSINGKVADMPNGITIDVTDLVDGSVLKDGEVVAYPSDSGVHKLCKYAKCLTGSTGDSIKVESVGNQFKVGDPIMSIAGGVASNIASITSSAGIDTIVPDATIDAPLSNGGFIYEAAAEAATNTSALKYDSPVAITGTAKKVDITSNLDVDAWVIAAVKTGEVGPLLLDALNGNYKSINEL